MSAARPPREPHWTPVDPDRRFEGRWVQLTYASSFLADPVRPLLRLRAGAAEECVALPAPVCGRAIWRGFLPPGADPAIDPGPGVAPAHFRIEQVRALSLPAVAARALRAPKAGLMGLAQHALGRREAARRRLALALQDETLAAYEAWRRVRRRAPEPEGLDRLSDALMAAPPIRFTGRDAGDPGWRETLASLQGQLSPRWELALSGGGAPPAAFAEEPRVRVADGPGATDAAGALATVALKPGDRLAPEAVAALAAAFLNDAALGRLSFDADEPAAGGRRPLFGWPHPADGAWAERSAGGARGHLARVLLHRAAALAEAPPPRPPRPADWPAVDIVVPTRDRAEMLMRCISSMLEKTRYPAFRIIVADNDSVEPAARAYLEAIAGDPRVTVTPAPGPFNFAAICNGAAALGEGAMIVFLNNDVAALEPGWLEALVAAALQPGAGVAGAKLIYPGGALQHGGVVLGLHGAAGHVYRGAGRGERGYRGALTRPRRASAVTGACLAVRRDLFEAAGGFDEAAFAVEFNDIDLCLRLARGGHATVWTPEAELVHLESASRGRPGLAGRRRAADERARFLARWRDEIANDPAYHPAFSLAGEWPRLA